MDPERTMNVGQTGQTLRQFRFIAEYALEEVFNCKDNVLEKESDAEDSCNNYLYQVTSASRIDI